jgi:predicted transposase/invertase (TIGR01784 family)
MDTNHTEDKLLPPEEMNHSENKLLLPEDTDLAENRLLLPRYDVIFKSIFKDEGNKDVVEDFLRAMLDIPDDETFEDIIVQDSELLPEAEKEKLSILDVRLKIPGQGLINVEMQLCRLPEIKERMLYYLSKTAAHQIPVGANYADFNRVIMIVISDFNFIDDSASYYNRYRLYDKEHDSLFTDKIEFVILELRKLSAESDHSERWNWAKFFNSKTDAELRVAAAKNERIAKAMLTIEKLSADEAARLRAEYKEMQDLDHISRMEGAKREGRAEGVVEERMKTAKRMKSAGMDFALIVEFTGLSEDEVTAL